MAVRSKTTKAEPTKSEDCPGGLSWGRKTHAHKKGKIPDIECYRCHARMGCSLCVETSTELLCLRCHNWACKEGVEHYGNIVVSAKVPHVRTDAGWLHYDQNFKWPWEQNLRAEIAQIAKDKMIEPASNAEISAERD